MTAGQSTAREADSWTPDIPRLDRMVPQGLKVATFAMG